MSDNIFSYLKSRLPIATVVGDYVSLSKAGGYLKAHCPFHSEKTASFTVSPHKEIFYCFGCQSGGDVITFIERIEHCSTKEALAHLVQRYQIDIPEELMHHIGPKVTSKKIHDLLELLTQLLCKQYASSSAAQTYMRQRGVNQESITRYRIGLFPGGNSFIKTIVHTLQEQGFLVDELINLGILSPGKSGVLFSPFEDRIIFPITDALGRLCGFGGRVYKKTDERGKYYNSRESELFNKGSLLFGIEIAKHAIQQQQAVFLVEGYLDCILMAQHGFANTVATLGTACTLEQLELISRYAHHIYLLYDGDAAGQQAILRVAQLAWQANLEIKVIVLPAGHDPASFLSAGNDLKPLVATAQDIFSFYVATLGDSFKEKSLAKRLECVHKIVGMIAHLDDIIKQELLLAQAAHCLELPFAALQSQLEKTRQQSAAHPQKAPSSVAKPEEPIADQPTVLEAKIVNLALQYPHLLTPSVASFLTTYLPTPFSDILTEVVTAYQKQPDIQFVGIFDQLSPQYKSVVSSLCIQENVTDPKPFDALVNQLQKKYWKYVVQTTKQALEEAKAHNDEALVAELLHNFLALRTKIFGGTNTTH